jgi:DNA invertase Pin-like site-specific DNA recombinase
MLLGYMRVSTLEQATPGKSSMELQEGVIRGYAMTRGFSQFDVAIYRDDGISASIPLRKRPEGARLLEDAKLGDTIIASKLDRMFRSASDALNMSQIFAEKQLNLVLFDLGSDPVNQSGMAQFIFTILAAVAQLERTMIRERLSGGKHAKLKRGGHAGGEAPYGWKVIGHGKAARREPIEEEQKVLAWLKERADLSIREATRQLEREGMRSRNGKPFVPMQVSRMFQQVRDAAD